MKNQEKELITLEKKVGEQAAQELRNLPVKELEFKLLQLAKHKEEIVTTAKNDLKLQEARDLVKELNAPYKEQATQVKNKSRFIALLIKEMKGEE